MDNITVTFPKSPYFVANKHFNNYKTVLFIKTLDVLRKKKTLRSEK